MFNWPKFWQRVLTIVIYAPVIIVALYLGDLPFFILVIVGVFISLLEIYNMYNLYYQKHHDNFYYGYLCSILLLSAVFMQKQGYTWENNIFLLLSAAMIGFFIFELARKKIFFLRNQYAYLFRSVAYTGLMYVHVILLRNLPGGFAYCLYLFLVVWVNDIMAYLIGICFGRHRLAPGISPKKSIEGALGGLGGAVGLSVLFSFFHDWSFQFGNLFVSLGGWQIGAGQTIFLGAAISVFAQLGDLLESLLKRSLQAKDSGSLLPGHGGVLDRMDSFVLTFPIFYYFVYYFAA
ncbi:phosphatidate cytidylyltransferase [Candidatus Termititenax persephonae]|uniref:Phosphatidate cytidylyltransferase n=1 Tax=Candidatus Termititenax persephonae TaxID=2218525 RepID=A0A388TJT9_9BACT|nr:phosphatidate cytidylyltransferase [Candidatus Termititenax persephonae]